MKILVLSPFLCGTRSGNGGGVLSFKQAQVLSEHHTLAFLAFSEIMDTATESSCLEELATICTHVTTVPLRIRLFDKIRAQLHSVCLRTPVLASLCDTPEMLGALKTVLNQFDPDVVWIQFPQMAQYQNVCGNIPCVMDVQDAYSLSGFRQAQRRSGINGFRSWLDWVCWTKYEAHHYPRFADVLTLSDQDAQVLHAYNLATPSRCIGVPLASNLPNLTSATVAIPTQIGFAGSFSHQPNIEGVLWFTDKVWPRVIQQLPHAQLVIAGKNPPPSLTAKQSGQIRFAGFVPDINEFYASNVVTVVPLVSGGGIKIKTVEAMLAGSALVSTSIGMEGIACTNGKEALIADDPQTFADHIVRIMQNDSLRTNLANAAKQLSEQTFSARAWSDKVQALLQHISHGQR